MSQRAHCLYFTMGATARSRLVFNTVFFCLLLIRIDAAPDKLSLDQKPPLHFRSSAGRALALPASGQTPANVGLLKPSKGGRPGSASTSTGGGGSPPQQDDVQREESVSYKEVNGETIRVVSGNYAYQSPEGLPVSFKYMADENGNKASFSIGTAAGGGGGGGGKGGSGSRPSSGGKKPSGGAGGGGGPGGAGRGGAGGAAKGSPADGDRKYLPPT